MSRTSIALAVAQLWLAQGFRRAARRLEAEHAPFDRMVWLLGAPRTGSTWLASMLGSHPGVRVVDEPLLGAHLGTRVESTLEAVLAGFDTTLREMSRERSGYVFADSARGDWVRVLQDLVRVRLLQPMMTRPVGAERVVIKEPHGSEAAPLLMELTPGSRLLFLVRDPRDCVDSILDIVQQGWMGRRNGVGSLDPHQRQEVIGRITRFWAWRIDAVQEAYDQLPPTRRHIVRYEDLRRDPAGHLRPTLSWMGLPVTDGWAVQCAEEFAFERVPPHRRGPGQFHRLAQPGGWRESLTNQEQAFVATTLHEHLERFDYPLT